MLVSEPGEEVGADSITVPGGVLVINPGIGVGVGTGVIPVSVAVLSDPGGVPLDAEIRAAVPGTLPISDPIEVAGVGVPILHYNQIIQLFLYKSNVTTL